MPGPSNTKWTVGDTDRIRKAITKSRMSAVQVAIMFNETGKACEAREIVDLAHEMGLFIRFGKEAVTA